jgi:hypothetical protein
LINSGWQASIDAVGAVRPAHQPIVTAVRVPSRPRQQRGVLLTTHSSRHGHAEYLGGHPPVLRAAVTDTLTRIEADMHRHGWDQPPALIGIFRHPPAYDLTRTAIHANRSTVDLVLEVDDGLVGPATWYRPDPAAPPANLHPVDVLLGLRNELAVPAMRAWLRDWLHRDGRRLLAFGFCFEGWQAPIRPGYRHGDLGRGPASQRTEVRVVAARDRHGHVWRLIRARDAFQPDVTTGDSSTRRIGASRVLTGLHRLNHLGRTN